MAYSPGTSIGQVGEMYIEPGASISAWKHEYRHFTDDRKDGYLGFRVFMDKEKCRQREIDAYQEEIDFASKMGYNDVVDKLIKLRDREIEKYV